MKRCGCGSEWFYTAPDGKRRCRVCDYELPRREMDEETLTGVDYATRPLLELSSHPDFSTTAYLNIAKITKMSTKELESLRILVAPTQVQFGGM